MSPHRPLAAIALLSTLSTSCVAVAALAIGAAAAIGVIKYTENGAQEDFKASLEATFDAAVESLTHHDYDVPAGQEASGIEAELRADDATVHLKRFHGKDGDFTRATVKIGTFDTEEHRAAATRILTRMRETLGG